MNEKDKEKIKAMTEGGKILFDALQEISKKITVGIQLKELDKIAQTYIEEAGAKPAFLNYQPAGADRPFPASICASLNEEIVHGLPDKRVLKEGDILTVDLGVKYKGFYTDSARTFAIGEVSKEIKHLLQKTEEALYKAIKECYLGKTLGDIGFAISSYAKKNNLFVVKSLTGHGVGKVLHDEPTVLNFGKPKEGMKLESGMTLAIEPMLSLGSENIIQMENDSYSTSDGSLSAHFEHTVAITDSEPLILTK